MPGGRRGHAGAAPEGSRRPAFGSHCTPPAQGCLQAGEWGWDMGLRLRQAPWSQEVGGRRASPSPTGLTLGCRRQDSPQGPVSKGSQSRGRGGGREQARGPGGGWRSGHRASLEISPRPRSPGWQPAEWTVRGTAWGSPVLWPVSPLPAAGWEGGCRTLPLLRGHSLHPYLPPTQKQPGPLWAAPNLSSPRGPQTALGSESCPRFPRPCEPSPQVFLLSVSRKEAREAG